MAVSFISPFAEYMDNPELTKVRKHFHRFEKNNFLEVKLPARQLQKNLWIVKPENENRGRGIELVSSWKELISLLCQKVKGEPVVIQKYIERPLLFNGRKFDIRVLALIDDEKNFYWYKLCYLRTSSDEYTLSDKSKYIHLTNNCFQMHSQNYEKHERGNQLPYSQFLEYIEKQYSSKFPDLDSDHITQRMKDLMIDCFLSAYNSIDPKKRPGHKFEVLGFDIILDR